MANGYMGLGDRKPEIMWLNWRFVTFTEMIGNTSTNLFLFAENVCIANSN